LPHLIGDAVGNDTGFDASVSGESSVEFSTAAFRFGHTLVSSSIDLVGEDGTDAGSVALMDAFFNHSSVEDNGIEAIMRGQLSASAQELDTEIVDDLNFFLETPDGVSGFSLAALNLARGLDHARQVNIHIHLEVWIEERLNHQIVIAITFPTHPLPSSGLFANHERGDFESILGQTPLILVGTILRPAFRMVNAAFGRLSQCHSHVQRPDLQIPFHTVADHCPAVDTKSR
jgi:hypothetical protein